MLIRILQSFLLPLGSPQVVSDPAQLQQLVRATAAASSKLGAALPLGGSGDSAQRELPSAAGLPPQRALEKAWSDPAAAAGDAAPPAPSSSEAASSRSGSGGGGGGAWRRLPRELAVMFWRTALETWRNPSLLLLHWAMALGMGLLLGSIFFQVGALHGRWVRCGEGAG